MEHVEPAVVFLLDHTAFSYQNGMLIRTCAQTDYLSGIDIGNARRLVGFDAEHVVTCLP